MKGVMMNRKLLVKFLFSVACLCLMLVMVGCGSSDSDNDGSSGTARIVGNISSFETASAIFYPVPREKESMLVRLASLVSNALVPSAHARSNLGGIRVQIDGPVSRSTETSPDGSFAFSNLPAGSYLISFECDGERVRYRGRSGQSPTITLKENQVAEMINIRISGGRANIGNIKIESPDNDDDSDTT
jgi:hypothetical protein